MFDLVIQNGYVVDPSSKTSAFLNVGIKDGKISQLSSEKLLGKEEIDGKGLIVSPGFVDMHIHEDPYSSVNDAFEPFISLTMLKMGVTTAIAGNCGIGETDDPVAYLNNVDRLGYPMNMGMLAPHEKLRAAFGEFGRYDPVDGECIEKMKALLGEFLDGGCLGLSLGLEYIPGTGYEECRELIRVASERGKITTVHQRSDGKHAMASVKELLEYGEEIRGRIHISHLSSMCSFGGMTEVISAIDEYRSRGVDICFDCYPYFAFCASIGSAVFDEGFFGKYDYGDEYFKLLQVVGAPLPDGEMNKKYFYELREENPELLVVAHILNEKEVDMCITHPASIVVSDGLYKEGKGHPRGSGTFPKLIREYVLERKLLTLEGAIEKITALPAERMGLQGKGSLKPGSDADITIFDLNKIKDGASYGNPTAPPEGIEYVIINGKTALKKGEIINPSLGRAIRK